MSHPKTHTPVEADRIPRAKANRPAKTTALAIRAALLLMGGDSDTIAEYLLDRGARGLTDGSIQGCCPVSRWIVKRFDARAVSIGVKTALVKVGDRVLTVEVPMATRTFLSRFDAGYYPELEDRS